MPCALVSCRVVFSLPVRTLPRLRKACCPAAEDALARRAERLLDARQQRLDRGLTLGREAAAQGGGPHRHGSSVATNPTARRENQRSCF